MQGVVLRVVQQQQTDGAAGGVIAAPLKLRERILQFPPMLILQSDLDPNAAWLT
jgi:hypothetical protein